MGATQGLLLCSLLWISSRAKENEFTVTCTSSEPCALPCQFHSDGKGARIMWYKRGAIVSCTRYGNTSFVIGFNSPADSYKGRTDLFVDQVLEGNATLLLKNVTPHDQGKYFCITMTAPRTDQSGVISLVIKAPVQRVHMGFSDDAVICVAKGIYPTPKLSWFTDPPTDVGPLQAQTTTKENQLGLYDIQSLLQLKENNHTNRTYICRVAADTNQRTAFLNHHASILACPGTNITVPCSLPQRLFKSYNLSWTFGLSDLILSISVSKGKSLIEVSDQWKPYVSVSLPPSIPLKLLQVKPQHQGTYTCEVNTKEETHITQTDVTMHQEKYVPISSGLCCSLVILGILLLLTFKRKFFGQFVRRFKQGQAQEVAADESPETEEQEVL